MFSRFTHRTLLNNYGRRSYGSDNRHGMEGDAAPLFASLLALFAACYTAPYLLPNKTPQKVSADTQTDKKDVNDNSAPGPK